MRLSIECGDIVGALSRALDQIRRMGIETSSVAATSHGPDATIQLELHRLDARSASTLRERVLHIPTVRNATYLEDDRDPS
ncbi:MAG TPA: hypothetical protein PL183_03565 [Aquamicrobium sp.]|nr:hypothetical protein [Aquamicrobium sp.]